MTSIVGILKMHRANKQFFFLLTRDDVYVRCVLSRCSVLLGVRHSLWQLNEVLMPQLNWLDREPFNGSQPHHGG